MISPLFYTRIGEDILNRMNVRKEMLRKGMLLDKMLELYIRGGLGMWSKETILTSHKLRYPNVGDVDIWNSEHFLLCESSCTNKKDKDIHVHDYFKDTSFIRVCSTRDQSSFNDVYYRIPYAKLCCMIDTGDVFKLNRTCQLFNNR